MQLTTESLARFVGGQLEIQNQGENYIFRGEIGSIVVGEETVKVRFTWLAKGKGGFPPQGWIKDDNLDYAASTMIYTASDIGNNRVAMHGFMNGETAVFFPADGSKLDPARVEGLGIPVEPKPLHNYAPDVLKTIAEEHSTKTGVDLQLGQAEFRGAMRMLFCKIPKGHSELRHAIRDYALMVDMTDDPLTKLLLDHIENESQKVEMKQAS